MNIKEATAIRIEELCKERTIAINKLANLSGITPSTVYSILDKKKNKTVSLSTVKKICDGLDITIKEFFDSKIFDELEQEIY